MLAPESASGPLLTVEARGGHCREGPCESVLVIERDGRVHRTKPQAEEVGRLEPGQVAALEAAIRAADFERIQGRPFTGECPTAYDGQELVYEFSAGTGVQRVASCEIDIDAGDPLWVTVEGILALVSS